MLAFHLGLERVDFEETDVHIIWTDTGMGYQNPSHSPCSLGDLEEYSFDIEAHLSPDHEFEYNLEDLSVFTDYLKD